jgi:hypothetical protein
MFENWRHVRTFRHWPKWVVFNTFVICENCIKPPSRPRRMVPVFQRVPVALH